MDAISCKNCMFWYAEDRWLPPFCHGSTDEDCDSGQMELGENTLIGVYGMNKEQVYHFKRLRASPEINKILKEIEKA